MQAQAHPTDHGPTSFCLGIFNEGGCLQAMGEPTHALSQYLALCCSAMVQEDKGEGGNVRAAERAVCVLSVHVGRAKIISKKRFSYEIRRRPELLDISQTVTRSWDLCTYRKIGVP